MTTLSVTFPRWLITETTDSDHPLSKLFPFVLGKALNVQIGTLKSVKRLQKGEILVETRQSCIQYNAAGTHSHNWRECQLRSAPTDHSTSAEELSARDIASCSVEEIVDELRPQGVTAAVIIHVRDGDSKRRTKTVILTFASPQPPKHIIGRLYMRVPVAPYIPKPLRCFNCQKYGHSSRACKNSAACVKCGEAGHEGASCSVSE